MTTPFRDHMEEIKAAYNAEARAADETLAVLPEPSHADLHARLKLGIELAKIARRLAALESQDLEARVAKLEAKVVEQNKWIESMKAAGITHLDQGSGYNL